MADARSLLKARRQEARISHPLAIYSASGDLKCSICGTGVKHASAWEGHLGSKTHRTNVARLKEQKQREREAEQERARRQQQAVEQGSKRQAEEEVGGQSEASHANKKRRVEGGSPAGGTGSGGFPSDFFSDSSRRPELGTHDSDESDEDDGMEVERQPSAAPVRATVVDAEYERFQRELMQQQAVPEVYDSATLVAEPVLVTEHTEGFPVEQVQSAEVEEETEEGRRQRKEQEERELIMDRLLDEERAQEDADMRVSAMKARIEVLKRRRAQKLGQSG